MTWKHRIEVDAAVLAGKPVVRGTRIAVEQVIDCLAHGWTTEEIVAQYPALTPEDVQACLKYARDALKLERAYPTPER